MKEFPSIALPVSFGGEARQFTEKIDDFGPMPPATKKQIRKGLKVMCREIKMGVAASQLAIADSRIDLGSIDPDRIGVEFGSDYIATLPDDFVDGVRSCAQGATFEFDEWAEQGLPKVTPLWLLKYLPNMPACHVAIYNDLRGPNNSITQREASSNLAVAEATSTIQRGAADFMVTGATGCRVHPLRSVHTVLQEELATDVDDPANACRPFDRDRQGTVLGEGAASLMLESLDVAESRSAKIFGEVVGYGSSSVMSPSGNARRGKALSNVLKQALQSSGIDPSDIGHIHAHGLGTKQCDAEEGDAIRQVFGEDVPPIVCAKANFGNLGAASGLVELIASIYALQDGQLFPARNFENMDPDCGISLVQEDTRSAGDSVLSVNVSPQGQASAIVVRRI